MRILLICLLLAGCATSGHKPDPVAETVEDVGAAGISVLEFMELWF